MWDCNTVWHCVAIPLVTWCTFNRSGKIRARIIQELARIIKDLHQNKVAKGLCFFGGLTCKLFVHVTVAVFFVLIVLFIVYWKLLYMCITRGCEFYFTIGFPTHFIDRSLYHWCSLAKMTNLRVVILGYLMWWALYRIVF